MGASKVVIIAVGLVALFTSHTIAEEPILRSLPANVQKEIEQIRQSCREIGSSTVAEGDDGLRTFTVSGVQAVLIDELDVCGGGFDCIHGVNCATGYTHDVAIYVRSRDVWRKSFSVAATDRIFLSIEPYTGKFRALVLSVHGGDEALHCPLRDKNAGDAWKHEKCDFVVKWDGAKFIYRPL